MRVEDPSVAQLPGAREVKRMTSTPLLDAKATDEESGDHEGSA
jgi:hypothetical protein